MYKRQTLLGGIGGVLLSNVTPFVPRSYELRSNAASEIQTNVSEPIDLSDDLVKIDIKLKELEWTEEQERKYLQRTYEKNSRQQLKTEQIQEFRRFLELFSQTSKELKDLQWTNQQGSEYLLQTYKKRSRQYLNNQELREFLQHLQDLKAERDRALE